MTLGTLLELPLRVTANGRLAFGDDELTLNRWMDENAFVTWAETSEPWVAERQLISMLDLPLNLEGNEAHAFWPELSRLRAEAKARARLGIGR